MSNVDDDFFKAIDSSMNVLVVQPDRPDGDSLASALFLEDVLSDAGKDVYLYCGVNVPEYIRFIPGWDRVYPDLPSNTDMIILVDDSSLTLIQKFDQNPVAQALKAKPFVVADHHTEVECDIPYATINISRPNFASAGDLLYTVFKEKGYDISLEAKKLVMQSILSDTLGLTSPLVTADTYRTMAELTEAGVERAELEELRREYSKLLEQVFRYKAELMDRTELSFDGEVAICVITEDEAYGVGTLYNPGPLILSELLMIRGLKVAIAIKTYHNRATAAIRCTHGNGIAHELASKFGGGGHAYSAGFKIENWDGDLASLKQQVTTSLSELIQ